jgi:hypothetical protein
MKFVFIISIMFLGVTTAQGQTMLQPNGQTNSNGSAVQTNSSGSTAGSAPSAPTFNVPTPSLSSAPSPSPGSQFGTLSQFGTSSGSATTTGSASGARGANSQSASRTSQSPLLLPGEIPDTSTQSASTTATAPSSPSPACPLPVPATDGGSANLTEIAGASLGGC